MVAFILVCLVLLLGLLWGWEIRKRKSLEQEFVKKKNEVCSVKEFSDTILYNVDAKLLQKSEMRKDIVIELSYKGFG